MAKTQFSSKVIASLAARVFLVCFTFLIIPLSIFSIYLLYQEEGTKLFPHLLIFILLTVIFGGGATFFLIWKMGRPLKQLHTVMRRVGLGELNLHYCKDKWGFEINELGSDFNQMIQSLLESIELAKNEKVAREVIQQELRIGHEIQKSLFPKALPHLSGVDLAAYFVPAKEISGDFYDLFMTREGKLLIVMADAAGKGISACLYSFLFRNILRSLSEKESNLAKIIPLANHLFKLDAEESGNFITAWIGLYDPATRELEYGCFGHPPALLLHQDGTVTELGLSGSAFGVM
ncbi:MAG TPA: SpoIIE family protein phosphatase, partial [Rhabdochlamydiaceae bacterium]|nr:SpoIIE family protein phosphatase [Rhabdochlamydiaceae bacterium]